MTIDDRTVARCPGESVQDVLAYNGSSWAASAVPLTLAQSGSFLEMAIPLASLGSPRARWTWSPSC